MPRPSRGSSQTRFATHRRNRRVRLCRHRRRNRIRIPSTRARISSGEPRACRGGSPLPRQTALPTNRPAAIYRILIGFTGEVEIGGYRPVHDLESIFLGYMRQHLLFICSSINLLMASRVLTSTVVAISFCRYPMDASASASARRLISSFRRSTSSLVRLAALTGSLQSI